MRSDFLRGSALVCFVLWLCSLSSACAQKLNVTKVVFSGDTLPAADLQAGSGLNPGSLDATQVQAAAQKLNDTGMFAHIDFAVRGAVLQFQLTPASGRLPAHFENFPWWTDSALTEKIHATVPLFEGQVIPGTGLDQQVVAALTTLAGAQHPGATVESQPEISSGAPAPTAVRYRLATPAVIIGTVAISGQSSAMTAELDPIAKAAHGQPYDEYASLDLLSQAVRTVYGNHGYLDASTDKLTHGAPLAGADGVSVPLNVGIAEGSQYWIKTIDFAHPLLLSEAEFKAKASLHPGDVANQELLRRSLLQISRPYAKQGYIHAKVSAEPSLNHQAAAVTYMIEVDPGDLYRFGKLDVAGLSDAQKAEFLKNWKLQSGDIYDATYPAEFLHANAKTLRSLDGYSATYKQIEHLDTHVADLVITFRKDGTLR